MLGGLTLADGFDLLGADVEEVWWGYAVLGGRADPALLARRMVGEAPVEPHEHILIAQALNECFADHGMPSFPVGYADDDVGAGEARAQVD